ncbi:uncharacterized protein LOC119681942 [Teleopsis dalmanni]|uniref:uncharacterized protein LOC119681942 n=1 Tax=Teleopsis dalmanni TaxID=139649 RepID=UPI0018CC8ED4|nr:uncharacterized protein LOC119681942 [Teleopsis dalmanni]
MSFEPRSLVNGNILRQYTGKNVSIMLQVEKEDGRMLIAKSTDNLNVRVAMPQPQGVRNGDWVEVIGVPTGADSINAKEVITFPGQFSLESEDYNMMVRFLNNAKDVFRQG